jgi:hypothetical protein
LSAKRTGLPPPPTPKKSFWYSFLLEAESIPGPQCGRKDYVSSNETIGNRTRDLAACSAMPQPTAPPAACPLSYSITIVVLLLSLCLLSLFCSSIVLFLYICSVFVSWCWFHKRHLCCRPRMSINTYRNE